MAMAIASAASCQEGFVETEIPEPQQVVKEDFVISATFDAQTDTRTSLTSEGKVLWSKGDAFALLSASSRDKFTLITGDGEATASFSGSLSGSAPYYALYPYSEDCSIEGGVLKFKLPQEQKASLGTFGDNASPALATMPAADSPAAFKNLCGVLEVNLNGSSIKISGISVTDLSGAPLWGDCSLALDGKQGTNEQTMTVTGGSNTIYVELDKVASLLSSTPKTICVVVPAGSFSKGYTIKVYDVDGNAIAFLTTQNSAAAVKRSMISAMEKVKITTDFAEPDDTLARGYFKDLFMDGGTYLTSRVASEFPSMPYLGWEFDYLATSDSAFQNRIMVESDIDLNGALLYPDNEPRYRVVYCNGGKAASHGRSLLEAGRNRYITFVNNGGSYIGTCAGAFMASTGTSSSTVSNKRTEYLGIFPSYTSSTGLTDSCTHMTIPEDSPLLDYYDFGGDYWIDSVRHNGGCYLSDASFKNVASKAEKLLYYYAPGKKYHDQLSAWSYKANTTKGRVISCGSHPEGVATGERRDLFAAFALYAADGVGLPATKSTLTNGYLRKMDQLSSANKPGTSRIGEKQYHHFKINVPAGGVDNFKLELGGDDNYNLTLSLRKGGFAWRADADYVLAQNGSNKTLELSHLDEGSWYISVYCAHTIKVTCASGKFTYTGDTSLLNGVAYTIKASWD